MLKIFYLPESMTFFKGWVRGSISPSGRQHSRLAFLSLSSPQWILKIVKKSFFKKALKPMLTSAWKVKESDQERIRW